MEIKYLEPDWPQFCILKIERGIYHIEAEWTVTAMVRVTCMAAARKEMVRDFFLASWLTSGNRTFVPSLVWFLIDKIDKKGILPLQPFKEETVEDNRKLQEWITEQLEGVECDAAMTETMRRELDRNLEKLQRKFVSIKKLVW